MSDFDLRMERVRRRAHRRMARHLASTFLVSLVVAAALVGGGENVRRALHDEAAADVVASGPRRSTSSTTAVTSSDAPDTSTTATSTTATTTVVSSTSTPTSTPTSSTSTPGPAPVPPVEDFRAEWSPKLSAVTLGWAPVDGAAGYVLHRGDVVLTRVDAPSQGYSDTLVKSAQRYTYAIQAVDGNGRVGPLSTPVSVDTATDTTPPPRPTDVRWSEVDSNLWRLRWSFPKDSDVVEFRVYYEEEWAGTVPASKTEFFEYRERAKGEYYSVTAVDAAGNESARAGYLYD